MRRERERLRWTQEQLGTEIGADQAYVSRVEAGQVNVSLDSIGAFATALGIEPAVLFGLSTG